MRFVPSLANGLISIGYQLRATTQSDIYSGEFKSGEFTGKGSFTSKNYGVLVGEFESWYANGEGVRSDSKGNQWKGKFEHSKLHGEGEYIGVDGEQYKGTFEYGYYNGEGYLVDTDGNQYWGSFSHGKKDGRGKFEYKEPFEGVKKFSGKWRYGKLVEDDANTLILPSDTIGEYALYNQQRLLRESIAKLESGDKNRPDLYLLAIAGWGKQEVFNREINYIESQFNKLFNTEGRSVLLANSQRNIESKPLATITSIKKAIKQFSEVMDKEEDIFFLYATSHGSQEEGLSLGHNGLSLPDLSFGELGEMLKESGIKHKVIVISACYSGGFVDAVKDDNTLILTSASADKKSFGCADDRLFTYFGKAFFDESLEDSESFVEAFYNAEKLIHEWEENEGLTPSEPTIYTTDAIEFQLEKWRKTLADSGSIKRVTSR